jgi:fructose-1,6-bisphosphatase/inositol monophosphatase family enzyme
MLPDRDFFDALAAAAKAETLPRFRTGLSVVNKLMGGFDPVTEGDRAAETAIRSLIAERFPEHGILGEEHENVGLDREHIWVIDPIDGTRAFISGLPVWGTLIGFQSNGRAAMGMMDQPFIGERYFADQAVEERVRLFRYGCDCYAYVLLASGHIDIVVENNLKPYDVGALIPIIEQAGGIITTWDGGRPENGGNILAAGSKAVHVEAMKLLSGK